MEEAYEKALFEIGYNGRFHKRFNTIYNIILVVFISMGYMNVTLVLNVPPHTCRLPEAPQNMNTTEWKNMYLPKLPDAKGGTSYSSCEIYDDPQNTNETVKCANGYDYDRTWYGSTVATAFNWVCDEELRVAHVFSYSRLGEVFGTSAFGWFGDTYGRKSAHILALGLMVLGRSVVIASQGSFLVIVIGSFISSFPSGSAAQSTLVMSLEMSHPEHRSRVALFQNVAWSAGFAILPLLYWWLSDWWWFILGTTSPLTVFLIFSWAIIESPRWLLMSGKNKKGLKQLQYIAKVNRTKMDPATEVAIKTLPAPEKANNLGPLAVFSSITLAINTMLLLTGWICISICYNVLIFGSTESFEENPHLQLAWQGIMELPGLVIGAYLAEKAGRRLTAIFALTGTASFCALTAFRSTTSLIWLRSWVAGAIVLGGTKICLTAAYYNIGLQTMEIYPTCLRQTGMSLGTLIAGGAAALAPYIQFMGRRVDSRLPGFITACTATLAAIAVFFLPETRNVKLPETLQEARNFGKSNEQYRAVRLDPLPESLVTASNLEKQ